MQEDHWGDLLDSGHDLRLDVAYADFYREQRNRDAQLPSPLETPELFTSLAKVLEGRTATAAGRRAAFQPGAGVQDLYSLVQGAPTCALSMFKNKK